MMMKIGKIDPYKSSRSGGYYPGSHQISRSIGTSLDKSEVSFSQNVHVIVENIIYNIIDVNVVTSHSRYLGFPVIFG